MSLSRKLLVSFGVMIGLVFVLSGGALVAIEELNSDLEQAANVTARKAYLAGDVNAAAWEITSFEKEAVINAVLGDASASVASQQRVSAPAARLRKGLAELRRMVATGETASILQTLDRQAVSVFEADEELRQSISSQQLDSALKIFGEKLQPRIEEIGRAAANLVAQQNTDLAATSVASSSKSAHLRNVTIGLMTLALVIGTLVFRIVRQTGATLRTFAARMAESADQVANAASQVSGASQALAEGATEQAASLQQTSASTEEVASITRKNADNALQVAGLMQQTEHSALDVNQTLDRMATKMKEIDSSSNKIARIIKVIDEIAFQTNILALNAAVEAARAGEAGLGFAVVADEVRNLAQRCAQAARDTAELIEESIENSHDGNARLDQMAGAVHTMTGNSSRVKSLVDEVNLGSQEQARGMEQISRAVLQMEQVTQKTAAGAQQSASAGTELNQYAAGLRGLVQQMREMVGAA
ncbi:MAG TPA: methyl-accepting chemotaxis protein [Bryobacteraceae bacterium]|nr:methyl-accepting chemotaxis protein [Bryobacteraceae bacterium]